jgi:hypothetical protein
MLGAGVVMESIARIGTVFGEEKAHGCEIVFDS